MLTKGSFKQEAECYVQESSGKYFKRRFGSGETETHELGVKETPEVIQTARESVKFDQSCVSSSCRKLTRKINQNQQCILKRGNKMTLNLPAPGNWDGEMNLQAQPAPGNWSEVETSESEGQKMEFQNMQISDHQYLKKVFKNLQKSGISQKKHQ